MKLRPPNQDSSHRLKKLREKAKEFRARHGYKPYTMVQNRTFEAEMMDTARTAQDRILIAIRRMSWGNLADWAMSGPPKLDASEPEPKPITQEQLAVRLKISVGEVSKSCKALKQKGYMDRKCEFLSPVIFLSRLESTLESEKFPEWKLTPKPLALFRDSLFSERPELGKSMAHIDAGFKQLDEEYDPRYEELRAAKRKIDIIVLGAWRDFQRTQGESEKRNKGESENPEKFPTPKVSASDSETGKRENTNKTRVFAEVPFKPIEERGKPAAFASKKNVSTGERQSVSQSVEKTDRPTDPHTRILEAIPPALTQKLGDVPSGQLLRRIAAKLNGAPIEAFTAKIEERFSSITGLGILEKLAADVAAAHAHNQQFPDASPPKPMNHQDAKREEMPSEWEAAKQMVDRSLVEANSSKEERAAAKVVANRFPAHPSDLRPNMYIDYLVGTQAEKYLKAKRASAKEAVCG